ncbi:MAG: hypothetical protein Q8P18_11290 [Pseudomonadota bacterium]|nr:hypothetical protein [Pseudomonadota bacterium]
MRTLLPLLILAAACSSEPTTPAPVAPPQPAAPAAAPTPAAAEHAGGAHAHASPHGGEVKTVGDHHVEALFMPGGIMFYVSDAAQKPLPIDGFTGSAVVKGPGGVETVTLAPMGDHLHARAKLAQGDAVTAVLTLTFGGKAESVSFETKAVGLQEHDHTSLHGGQVGMWGDYHLEYAPKDGEHRVWVTDAKRAQVTGVSGSLKDGDTVVPLTFDPAAGVLAGKNAGAGTRPVMVDVKVGETSFSLGFNPAAGEAAPASGHDHDHGAHAH